MTPYIPDRPGCIEDAVVANLPGNVAKFDELYHELTERIAEAVWQAIVAEGHLYQFDEDGMLTSTFCMVLRPVPISEVQA